MLARRRAWAALAIWAAAAAGVGVLAAANPTDYRPNPVKWHFARGLAWGRAGALDAAAAELREAVRLNPRLASARLNLGIVMAQAGDLEVCCSSLPGGDPPGASRDGARLPCAATARDAVHGTDGRVARSARG